MLFYCSGQVGAQVINDSIQWHLNKKAKELPVLNHKINSSVSEVSLEEFLRAIALANNLNLDIDNGLDVPLVNNFSDVELKDMLAYLCDEYKLYLVFTGNIISVRKRELPIKPYIRKEPLIAYDTINKLISLDFQNDTLGFAVKEITRKSGQNVVIASSIFNNTVTAYIERMPLEAALSKLAFSHQMKLTKTEDNFYLLEPDVKVQVHSEMQADENQGRRSRSSQNRQGSRNGGGDEQAEISFHNSLLSISAKDADLGELIASISEKTKTGYVFLNKVEGKISMSFQNLSYEQVMQQILKGTKYIYSVHENIYVIGEGTNKELTQTKLIELKRRSVVKLTESLPENITKDLIIKEFVELNGLIVSGPADRIETFSQFIESVDQKVPVVLIEVIIAYVSKSNGVSTGVDAGIADAPVTSKGTINPGLDFTVNPSLLNNMINSFDGFGWLNLSKVHPNFYLTLKALEETGYLEIKSTPKLSAINGHKASMKIGNKQYYLEEQTNIIGTQNPQTSTTKSYKEISADLSVTITPIVSGDEDITLEIKVTQSDFTEKISKYAPPGSVNREFESLIRVKNGEMILLGGLEDENNSGSSSGWPVLSKIPVVKWLFSSMAKSKSKSKLNLFIKPTILM